MKNLDVKKLLVFIAIIAVVVLIAIFGVKQLFGEKNASSAESEIAEKLIRRYLSTMTLGYTTNYNGIDVLYSNDKTTVEDLTDKEILYTAISYATDNGFNIAVSSSTNEFLKNSKKYENLDEYLIYNAEGIRDAIKELFGIEYGGKSEISEYGYLYDYIYDSTYDTYLMKRNNVTDIRNKNQNVNYHIIKTTKKDKDLMTTIAIAYTYSTENTKTYAKDKQGENIIAEDLEEFPVDKVDEFDQFTFTMTESENGTYTFKSIEKVN